MSITSGFFNSRDGDRVYDAHQMSSLFEGVIRDGVFESIGSKLITTTDVTNGDRVIVGTGRAWFNNTWTNNDAPIILEVPPPEAVLKRIDSIVLEVDTNIDVRKNTIKIVKGVPATTPVPKPRLRTEEQNQYMLAYVLRVPGKKITSGDITITVGTNEAPYVTAPIQSISLEHLMTQLRTQWTEWYTPTTNKFNTDVSDLIADYTSRFQSLETTNENRFNALYTKTTNDANAQVALLTNLVASNTQQIADLFLEFNTDYDALVGTFRSEFDAKIVLWTGEFSSKLNIWTTTFDNFISDSSIELTTLVDGFTDVFDTFMGESETEFNSFLATWATAFNGLKSDFTNFMTASSSEFETFMTVSTDAFDTWFAGLKSIMDENIATALLNKIDLLSEEVNVEKEYTSERFTSVYESLDDYNDLVTQLSDAIDREAIQREQLSNTLTEAISEINELVDTSNDNNPPSWYANSYPNQIVRELKLISVVGLPSALPIYCEVETRVRYHPNGSSAYVVQIAYCDNNLQFTRRGVTDTIWGSWSQVLTEAVIADYVIARGSNSKGSWEQWASGKLVCMADITLTSPVSSFLQGSWEFPKEFVSPPNITGSVDFGSMAPRASKAVKLGGVGYWTKNNSSCYPRVYSTAIDLESDDSVVVNLIAIGRWK